MSKQIFINLPVRNIARSFEFYSALGFQNNLQFSDDSAKCMVWSEHIYVMLLSHERFGSFTSRSIAETKNHLSALYSLSVESAADIHQIMERALQAGGTEAGEMRDLGFMQQRSVEDPDGFTWEIFFMDMSKMPQ